MENKIKKTDKKGKAWKIAAGIAAACAVAVGVTSLANPVLAEEIFSSVFGNLVENTHGEKYMYMKGEKYAELDRKEFTVIGENAITVQDEVDKQQDQGGYVTTVENNGVTVSVSDIYCDGYVLYYTSSIKTDNEDLNQADGIMTCGAEKAEPQSAISIDGTELAGEDHSFKKSKDGSFVGIHQLDLISPCDSNGEDIDLRLDEKDTLVVDWDLKQFIGYIVDHWDKSMGHVEGDWHLRFPVTVDRSGNKSFDINKEENGILVKSAVKTKAGILVEVELPDFTKEPYNDPYNDPYTEIKDSEGRALPWISQKWDCHEDGTTTAQIMVIYDGEKELFFEVTTKDEEPKVLANIGFQIP